MSEVINCVGCLQSVQCNICTCCYILWVGAGLYVRMYITHYLTVIIMHICIIILVCILCLILLPNQTNIGSRSNDAMVGLSDAIHGPLYAVLDTAGIYCSQLKLTSFRC